MSSAETADSSVDPPSKKRKLDPRKNKDMANNGVASSSQPQVKIPGLHKVSQYFYTPFVIPY